MSTIIEAPKGKFNPHPEGTFLATMCDCWLHTRPNPWKGTKSPEGKIDTRETITEIKLAFLTEEQVEIGGEMKPAYVTYSATASMAENSNLRKFIKGWFPKMGEESFARFDADKLLGWGAYITVVQKQGERGAYSYVTIAAQPPKGSVCPAIPADFVRRKDKPADVPTEPAGPVASTAIANPPAPPQPIGNPEDESDLPF